MSLQNVSVGNGFGSIHCTGQLSLKVFDTKQSSSHSLGAKTLTLAIPLLFSLSGGKDSPEYPSSICLGFQERARGSPLHVILCASSPAQSHIHHDQSLFDLWNSVHITWDASLGCTAMRSPLQAPTVTRIYHGQSLFELLDFVLNTV